MRDGQLILPTMARRAIVVGGGIGGLATAIALRQAGWQVKVLERQRQFAEIGASLTLWPNALAALDALGVGAAARAVALSGVDGGFMTTTGRWLTRLHTDEVTRRYGDVAVLSRPDLLSLLLSALPEDLLHPATEALSVERDGTVESSAGEDKVDLVVAADGVRSQVRRHLWPAAAPPSYSGFTAWRFNTRMLDEPVSSGAWVWGSQRSFGYTPLPGQCAYAYAIERASPGGESTSLDAFAGWREPIPRLIANVGESGVLRHDIYEGPTLKSLVAGRVALVGDAAHAMQPSLGQGACQALEDAVTLGRYADDLQGYDRERRRRTQRIVRESRLVMQAAHVATPALLRVRNASLAAVPRALNLRLMQADWAWQPPRPVSSQRAL